MPVSSLTYNYDAYLSSVLSNLHKSGAIQDQISTANAFFYTLIKKRNAYTGGASGDRMRVSLMYGLGTFDSYSSYDVLDTTPTDGMTAAFFNWGQASVPIAISGKEERENKASETQVFDLLKGKTMQAIGGAKEGFAKAFLQGNGPNVATAITTAFTSTANGSTFIDPLPLLVKADPTTSTTIGNINQSTYSWWRNQKKQSSATTFAGFLKEVDHLYNDCSKGTGGSPDLMVCDQNVFEMYTAALRSQNQFVQYKQADIPFENIMMKGKPLTWDEFVPDAYNGTVASIPVASSGTLYMLNTEFFFIKYFLDFEPTPFVKPENQDAKVSTLLWHGGAGVSNRRKHGVHHKIDTTIAA
jgi:hypothetical protein